MLWLLASLALTPAIRPAFRTAAVTGLRPPSADGTAELLRQFMLELNTPVSEGKSAVQRDACAAVVAAFNGGTTGGSSGDEGDDGGATAVGRREAPVSRVTAVLPAGAGKTVLALRVAEALRAQLTVVLVSSLDLASQSYRDWERWREVGFLDGWSPLAVCSSTSVPKAELPRTTDAAEVAAFLLTGGTGPRVLFCTYHSAVRVGEALARTGRSADLLVCDEAHRCTGRKSKRDAKPLSNGFLPASKRLFLTATPRLIGATRDRDGALVEAGSMDDERLFGPIAFRLGYQEAKRRGVVAPLKLVFLDRADLSSRLPLSALLPPAGAYGAERSVDLDSAVLTDLVELSLMMLDCRERYGVRTAFAFSADNRRAAALESVAAHTLSSHGFVVGRIDGSMLASEREARLAPLRNAPPPAEAKKAEQLAASMEHAAAAEVPTRLITNCRVLSEGVDLPAVDLVVFADPKHSHVDILQCMGRASRVAAGKPFGYVLVPVSEEAVEGGTGFKNAVSVMSAYAEQDEDFREALGALVTGEARMKRPLSHDEWPEALRRVLELPDASLAMERMVAERMVATVARELTNRWERCYGLLMAFSEREGHANVPKRHVEDGERLGGWVQNQRKRYKARSWSEAERKGRKVSALSDEEVQRLEALGVSWDPLTDQLERMYVLLAAYREREGHTNVPISHVEDGERLGGWVGEQRTRYKARSLSEAERKGRTVSTLSDEEVERLEALGVSWDPLADQWERVYVLLAAYREREGHANVPISHVEDGERLGGWVQNQRTRYKARSWSEAERKGRTVSTLSDEEVERLEALGVSWDPLADQWERMYVLLAAYREREGHANVPISHVEDGERLGDWVQSQRKRYKARSLSEAERKGRKVSALSDEEVERLEALGVSWDPLADQLERMYVLLAAYREREGHANVPKRHVEHGERLGGWVQDQRKRYKARSLSGAERKGRKVSALSDEEVQRLEALGVSWDPLADQWERMYVLLAVYRGREGHANVPISHVEDGERLGGWIANQRKRYKARSLSEAERKGRTVSTLSDEEVERLEALGVLWSVR